MVRLGTCNSCKMGRHKGHMRNYEPAPDGMFGGAMCPCQGECEGKPERDPQMERLVRFMRGRGGS